MFVEVLSDNDHSLRLSDSHKPNRFITEQDRLDSIKSNIKKIKAEVLKNIYDNVSDQVSDDTYYFNWSGLNLADKGSTIQEQMVLTKSKVTRMQRKPKPYQQSGKGMEFISTTCLYYHAQTRT